MVRESREQLSLMTRVLHWIVAIFMIAMIALGIIMDEFEVLSLYPIHKSLGVIALIFILVRVLWRIAKGWPAPASDYQLWEQKLSKLVHWLLLLGTMLFPISGMVMSGAAGYGISVFGLDLMAMNIDPTDPQKILPHDEGLARLGGQVHGLLGNLMIGLILLHVVGAIKHHFMDGDNTLRRMLGR